MNVCFRSYLLSELFVNATLIFLDGTRQCRNAGLTGQRTDQDSLSSELNQNRCFEPLLQMTIITTGVNPFLSKGKENSQLHLSTNNLLKCCTKFDFLLYMLGILTSNKKHVQTQDKTKRTSNNGKCTINRFSVRNLGSVI